MAELERLLVRIDATTAQLRSELKRADDSVGQFSAKVERSTSRINSLFAGMGGKLAAAFSVVKVTQFVQSAVEAADRIADLSKRTGVAAETLQRLQFIAVQSGTDIDALAKGWNRYSINLASAEQGTKAAQQRFAQLGLSFQALRALSPEDQLLTIADRIAALGNHADKTKALVDLFGKSAAELAPVFEGGADAMRRMFEEQGKILSNEQIQKIDEFNDRWNVMKLNLQAVAAEGFVELLDALRDFREEMGLLSDDISGMSEKALRKAAEAAKSSVDLLTTQQRALAKDDFLPIDVFRSREKSIADVNKRLQEAIDRYTGINIELTKFEKKTADAAKAVGDGSHKGGLAPRLDEAAKNAESLKNALDRMAAESFKTFSVAGLEDLDRELADVDAEVAQLENQFGALSEAQRQQVDTMKYYRTEAFKLNKTLEDQKEAAKEAERAQERLAEEFKRPFETAAENIQNLFSDTFEGIFDGSIDSAADAADAMKRIFIRLAAEMAALAIFRPEVLAAGGVGGLASGIFGGASQAGSGLPFGSDAIVSKGLGLTGVTGALDAFGASTFGGIFANAAPLAGTVGPPTAAAAGAAATLPFSMVALPVAALAATAIFSGLFKKSRPHPASTFGASGINASGSLLDPKFQAKHLGTEFAQQMSQTLQGALQSLVAAGLDFTNIAQVHGGVNDGKGFFSLGNFKDVFFDPENPEEGLSAVLKLIALEAGNAGSVFHDDLMPALQALQTDGKSFAEVLGQIQFLASRDALQRQFGDDLTLALLDAFDPVVRRLAEEEERFRAQLAGAQTLGLGADTIARINALHERNIALLTQEADTTQDIAQNAQQLVQRFGSVSEKFKSLLFDLQFGKLSPLNPRQRLDALRGQVQNLGRRARLGDVDAADELAGLLPEFVQLSAEFNGFNKNFEADRALAEDLAQATKSVAERQLEIQQCLLDETAKQSGLLAGILSAQGGTVQDNANDKIAGLVQSGKLSTTAAHAIIRSAGFTGPIGGGNVQRDFAANAEHNQKAFALLRAAGFDAGGLVTGGIPGVDSVPALLAPGEVVMRARAVQAIGAGNLLAANQTGRLANDNTKGIEQRLDRLTNVMQSLVNVTAASGNQSAALLQGVQDELSDIRSAARLEAAR